MTEPAPTGHDRDKVADALGWGGCSPCVGDYLELAWSTASVSLLGGALGSLDESERQRPRRRLSRAG